MASKLLKKGSELYGKKTESPDQGLKAKWAGAEFKMGDGIIAPQSKGRQYSNVNSPDQARHAAPQRSGGALTKDMTGGVPSGQDGYGKV